jgi:REP element-mobilizing transposase RayT
MVYGYHLVLTAYGFWLPNDPRGSWSDFVGKWELVRFGRSTRSLERRKLIQLTPAELASRAAARRSLKYDPVIFSGRQARGIGNGFANACRRLGYEIWACAILPEHTHLVISRHRFPIEQVANQLKGQATRQLIREQLHPLASFAKPGRRPPRMWAGNQWHVFLDSEEAIENAIDYVNENPLKECLPEQRWSFVRPYSGLPPAWTMYFD